MADKPYRIYEAGDNVDLGYCRKHMDARVVLVSENGKSLMLTFDGLLGEEGGGFYVGAMAVIWEPDQDRFVDLVRGLPVSIARG